MTAPIVLFVYNRPDHTLKTLDALSSNIHADQSELIVFADGPRADASDATLQVIEETRKLFQKNSGFVKSLWNSVKKIRDVRIPCIVVYRKS